MFIFFVFCLLIGACHNDEYCREGATRSALVLRGPGLLTLSSLITLTSSEFRWLVSFGYFTCFLSYFQCPDIEFMLALFYVSFFSHCMFLNFVRELLSGEKEGLLQLPSDKALLSDPIFRPYVDKYAAVCTKNIICCCASGDCQIHEKLLVSCCS